LIIKKLNEKSLESIRCFNFLTVYEGAVRSAKTVTSLVKFLALVVSSPDKTFLMSGATMGSISRNCLRGDFGIIAISGNRLKQKVDSDGNHYLLYEDQASDKIIYYCGADNERSYKKIQGMSIGGWYADEVNNQAKSFIEMAMSRSYASQKRFNIWTLNPSPSGHWFYSDILARYEKVKGYKYYHFTLDDNQSLSEERKQEIISEYPIGSVFYKRFILGLRVRAEGSCYPSFRDDNIITEIPEIKFCQVGVDIGGNSSATVFTLTGFYFTNTKWHAVVIDELYDNNNKSVEDLLKNFEKFVNTSRINYRLADCYVDSAEQLIKKSIRNTGLINTHDSLKKPIIDRIRFTDYCFKTNRLFIHKNCKKLIEAFNSAVWNEKSAKEERLDDGTYNVDSLDSFEYSIESKIKDFNIGVIK
jgi:PBSX family phage terminase large subunit